MKFTSTNKGSTFLLVLAMLSVLVLIAAALSYSTRMESVASWNYSELTQARIASATGLPVALPLLQNTGGPVSPLQSWYQSPLPASAPSTSTNAGAALASHSRSSKRSLQNNQSASSGDSQGMGGTLATITVHDLSGRVNINTITSERAFQRFLSAVQGSTTKQQKSSQQLRAQRLFAIRGTQPGTTQSLQPDLRKAAFPNTRRFESIGDLISKNDKSPESDDVDALSGYVTVFSQSPELFHSPDGASVPKVSLSNLTVHRALAGLKAAYPDKSPRLIRQFAANIIDFADADDTPTTLTDPEHPEPWNTIFGVEQAPLITEVYPDSSTTDEFGDAGQFVEIHNPWSKPIVLRNWRIAVGATATSLAASSSVILNGVLPPGGYLLITDNYDKPQDDSPAETGSFMSIFGTRADGSRRQVLEDDKFNLPNSNSYVALITEYNALVDVFSYTSTAGTDGSISYQRDDPRLRSFMTAEASPFDKPPQGVYTGNVQREAAMRDMWKRGNKGLTSSVDTLYVSSGYVGLRVGAQSSRFEAYPWQFPLFTKEAPETNVDLYLVDVFTKVPDESAPAISPTLAAVAQSQLPGALGLQGKERPTAGPGFGSLASRPVAGMSRVRIEPQQPVLPAFDMTSTQTVAAAETSLTLPVLYSYGKLNVNTCSKVALMSLDGEVTGRDYLTDDFVQRIDTYRNQKLAEKQVPFSNLSDFLTAAFPRPSERDIQLFAKLSDQITVDSTSFEVESENRVRENDKKSARRPSVVRERWVVALDRDPYSLIQYSIER